LVLPEREKSEARPPCCFRKSESSK
jgi:hypothetical protein